MSLPVLTLRDTDNELITEFDFENVLAGQYSDIVEVRVWNDYGETYSSSTAQNVGIRILNAEGQEEGDLVEQGWISCKIGHENDTADPLILEDFWFSVSKNNYANLGNIQRNTYRTIYLRVRPALGFSSGEISFRVSPFFGVQPRILPIGSFDLFGSGIVEEKQNSYRSGFDIQTSGIDLVTVTGGEGVLNSIVIRALEEQPFTVDQDDVNDNSLADGESYKGVFSADMFGNINLYKGEKAEDPETPNITDELNLGILTVLYTTGTTEIAEEDIVSLIDYNDYGYKINNGVLTIGKGKSFVNNRLMETGSVEATLEDGINNFYVTDDGQVLALVTEETANLILYSINFSVGVATVNDLRRFIGREKEVVYNGTPDLISKGSVCLISGVNKIVPCVTENSTLFRGIAEHDLISENIGFVITGGKALALITGSVDIGDLLVTSESSGYAKADNTAGTGEVFGKSLESNASGGLLYIDLI